MTLWLDRYNAKYADNLTPEHIVEWDITKFTKTDAVLELLTDDLFLKAEPYDGAIDFVKRLACSHVVRFASRPAMDGKGAKTKYTWIDYFLPDISSRQLILTHYKCALRGDIIVDDNPDFIKGFKGTKIVFTQPWNKAYKHWEDGMHRADSYYELDKMIRELSGVSAARERFRLGR